MARSSGSGAWAALSADLAAAADRVGPAVVAIHARERIPASGILWRPGIVLASSHTIRREQDITVTLGDATTTAATLAGRDVSTDLAVLRLEPSGAGSAGSAPPIGDAADLRPGELVLALGRPGRDLTATLGVVRTAGGEWRTWRGGRIDRMIRLDLAIHDGFSGGALARAGAGGAEIVGVTTSGLGRGAPIAVPASTVDRVIDQLLAHGRIPHGYLGIAVQPVRLPPSTATSLGLPPGGARGAITIAVEPGSPADQAGLVMGDVLVALDGEPIRHAGDLMAALGTDRVGHSIAIRIVRGGQPRELRVTVGDRGER